MSKGHIAFFIFPHGPHVHPTLAVVSTLLRRGYRVTYVTSDRFASAISDLGSQPISCADPFHLNVLDWTLGILSEVSAFYAAHPPDLVFYDQMCHAGRIFAKRHNIPAIQSTPAFVVNEQELSEQAPSPELRQLILANNGNVDSLFEPCGLGRQNYEFHRERLNICFYPKEFETKGNAGDNTLSYAGRCAAERPYRRTWRYSDGGRPLVLVSTSTAYTQGPEYFQMCIKALHGLPWRAVLAIGDNNDARRLAPLPAHFEIIQHAPQIQVLPYADLIICLGGMITTTEAMYHGVPLIMITHGYVEPEWYGDTFANLGLGIHLRGRDVSAEMVRDAVLRIPADSVIKDNVRRMQHAVKRSAGAEDTVNRIEEYLEVESQL